MAEPKQESMPVLIATLLGAAVVFYLLAMAFGGFQP